MDNHCGRMRKISNGRPRQLSRLRSETVTSTMGWQDVDIDEKSRRRREESRLSTVSSTSEDVDYLSSLTPSDTLVEMMTSKEVSQAGVVRMPVNSMSFFRAICLPFLPKVWYSRRQPCSQRHDLYFFFSFGNPL